MLNIDTHPKPAIHMCVTGSLPAWVCYDIKKIIPNNISNFFNYYAPCKIV